LIMNPVEKADLLTFLQCLQYIEPDNSLDDDLVIRGMALKPFIIDQDVLLDDGACAETFQKFYMEYTPKKDKSWNGLSLCLPISGSANHVSLAELYELPPENVTMKDFLIAKAKYTWLQFDPNLNHDAIFDTLLQGNLSKFRRMLTSLQKHMKVTYKLDYEFSDLTSTDDCLELIKLGKKFGGKGIEDYLDRLRMYCMAYAVMSSGSWRHKINHCELHKRLSWGDVIQDPRSGVRVNRRDADKAIAGPSPKESGTGGGDLAYPRLPPKPPTSVFTNWRL